MIIPNYTFTEYCNLSGSERDEINLISSKCRPFTDEIDYYGFGSFDDLGFGIVKDIQYDLQKEVLTFEKLFKYINIVKKIDINELYNHKLIDIINFKNYLISEIIRINNLENALLSHIRTDDEEKAGIEMFDKIGPYLQLRTLAKKKIYRIKKVRKTKYSLALLELYTRKTIAEYKNNIAKIENDRIKRNS